MITKLIAGGVAAAAVGLTGATLQASADPSTPSTPSTSSGTAQHHHRGAALRHLLRHAVRGDVVTENKQGQFVTHQFVHGTVDAVSATSIEVTAADHTSLTYTVTSDTRVRLRTAKGQKGTKGTMTDVHRGDDVVVLGTGAGTPTARLVVRLPAS